MFTAALCIIAKIRKHVQYPLTNKQKKKMWYTHRGILSSHKKKELQPFIIAEEPGVYYMLNEIMQKQKDI
jgi:hypothetical protein